MTLLAIATITFVLERVVPGDPALFLAGQNPSAGAVERIRKQYGLDRPLIVQYEKYMSGLVRGDLGLSLRTKRPVVTDVRQYLPATLELLLISFFVYIVLSLTLGMLAARRQGRWSDSAIRVVSMVGTGIPVFWLGIVLQLVFFSKLRWLPLNGQYDLRLVPPPTRTGFLLLDSLLAGDPHAFLVGLQHLVLPVATVTLGLLALGVRLTRGAIIAQYHEPYVRTARGKGMSEGLILLKHTLRNALNPIVTAAGTQFGYMISWIILVEVIFNWPGIGLYTYQSFGVFDYAPVIALALISTVTFAIVNLVTDVLYPVIDHRVERVER